MKMDKFFKNYDPLHVGMAKVLFVYSHAPCPYEEGKLLGKVVAVYLHIQWED